MTKPTEITDEMVERARNGLRQFLTGNSPAAVNYRDLCRLRGETPIDDIGPVTMRAALTAALDRRTGEKDRRRERYEVFETPVRRNSQCGRRAVDTARWDALPFRKDRLKREAEAQAQRLKLGQLTEAEHAAENAYLASGTPAQEIEVSEGMFLAGQDAFGTSFQNLAAIFRAMERARRQEQACVYVHGGKYFKRADGYLHRNARAFHRRAGDPA